VRRGRARLRRSAPRIRLSLGALSRRRVHSHSPSQRLPVADLSRHEVSRHHRRVRSRHGAAVAPANRVHRLTRRYNDVEVSSFSKSWPCWLPQHGSGKKHHRSIALLMWQQELVDRWPEYLLRGLIHSDGCRFQNTGRGGWSHPRYSFSNLSADIKAIFCDACDRLGLRWTRAGSTTIYVSRKADVAVLDRYVGPKC